MGTRRIEHETNEAVPEEVNVIRATTKEIIKIKLIGHLLRHNQFINIIV